MRSYSEVEVFTPFELSLLEEATQLVQSLPQDPEWKVRCHELARAVFQAIRKHPTAKVIDGKFGGCEHSWISILRRPKHIVLDVYAVGTLPMVQLIDLDGSFGLVGARRYIEGTERTDIDEQRIQRLLLAFNASR